MSVCECVGVWVSVCVGVCVCVCECECVCVCVQFMFREKLWGCEWLHAPLQKCLKIRNEAILQKLV